jgi:hypothetical protein
LSQNHDFDFFKGTGLKSTEDVAVIRINAFTQLLLGDKKVGQLLHIGESELVSEVSFPRRV